MWLIMSTSPEKNPQKPWFLSSTWQQMASGIKQMQKEGGREETEHSQIYGVILPIAAAGASLIVLFVIIMTLCFLKKKKAAVTDISGPSIVVYPSGQGSRPQFLTKDILFTLPPARHLGSPGDLNEESDSDADTEPLVPGGNTHSQRSNSSGRCGLGVIDPALYTSSNTDLEEFSYPKDHIGRLRFSLRYEPSTEKLLVSNPKAKNLPSRTVGTINGCDPLVRLHLLPDERRYRQSKMKKKTCNPFFDETFVFQSSSEEVFAKDLSDRLLKFTVVDSGRTKRRAVLGHVKGFAAEAERRLFEMDLEKEKRENFSVYSGELLISLLFNETLSRLSVTVVEGRKFQFKDPEKIGSYVKVTLSQNCKAVKAKRTATVRGAEEPSYFECFNFRLGPHVAHVGSLRFEVFQGGSGCGRDKLIGKFIVGPAMFARGKGMAHWASAFSGKFIVGPAMFARGKGMAHWASAFSSPKEPFQQWHILST